MVAQAQQRVWKAWLVWSLAGAAMGLFLYVVRIAGAMSTKVMGSELTLALLSAGVGAVLVPTFRRFVTLLFVAMQVMLRAVYQRTVWRKRAKVQVQHYISHLDDDGWGRTKVWDVEEEDGSAVAQRRARERLVVGVMTKDLEKSLTTSCIVLFVGLMLVGGYGFWAKDRAMLVTAALVCAFFVLAVARQSILAWRAQQGYFGSTEHEVRELLAFAVRHPTPADFYDDNGHLLPAFDLRPAEERAPAVGVPVPESV